MKALNEKQWWIISDHAGQPMPLHEVKKIGDSFVYDREYGYFDVRFGAHQQVMALLHSFHEGYDNYVEMCYAKDHDNNYRLAERYADEYLQRQGTCFLSSVSDSIQVWKTSNLNRQEKMKFRGFDFREMDDSML